MDVRDNNPKHPRGVEPRCEIANLASFRSGLSGMHALTESEGVL